MPIKGTDVVFGQNWIQQFQDNRHSTMTQWEMKRCSVSTIIWHSRWRNGIYDAMVRRYREFHYSDSAAPIKLTR